MWSKKPTCCIRLQTGLKFLALVDLVVAAFLLVCSVGGFVYYEDYYHDAVNFLNNPPWQLDLFVNLRNADASTVRGLLAFCLFYYLQKTVLGFILFFAALKESKFFIRLWVLYTLVLLVIHVLVYLSLLCVGLMEPWSIPVYVAAFIFREYVMWCSSTYLHRLVFRLTDEDDEIASSNGDDDHYSYKL